jgi:hypothetical protein
MEDHMTDLTFHLKGADAEKAAAELGAALEYEFDPIGRVGSAPAPLVIAHEKNEAQGGSGTLTMNLGLPSNALAEDELDQKLHILEKLRRLIEIAARYRESGTDVHLEADAHRRNLADMEPEDVLRAAKGSS